MKILAIWATIRTVIERNLVNIIVENNSQVTTFFITGKIVMLKQISNLVGDIKNMSRNIRNIRFSYCNRTTNTLTDRVEKRSPYWSLYKM